ncbi:unnamed protein product [Prunus armeniaca]|uniref:Uncharacterized protein n=1 Tax=Prunus armeniaca TaxID=36596 RepID=A0A6J5Y734_PRUAR|nr:unnamed protein product [Prunus armeniaca]
MGNLLYKARVLHQIVVSKLVQPKRVSCEGEETADTNELEKVDAALNALITHKSKKSDYAMHVENVQIWLRDLEANIQDIEEGLECLLRRAGSKP